MEIKYREESIMPNFEVNNVSVSTLLGFVSDGTIAIPEIQRPFVWDLYRACFASLGFEAEGCEPLMVSTSVLTP